MATVEHPQGPRRIGNVELPPIDQVGYVVKNLDETTKRYAQLFGPFSFMDSPLAGVLYRGKPADVNLLRSMLADPKHVRKAKAA